MSNVMVETSMQTQASTEKKQDIKALLSWALYDWASSAFSVVISTFVFAAFFVEVVAENPTKGMAEWGFITGLAGLAIAIGGPILGAIADHCGLRKVWIAILSAICIIATAFMWNIKPSHDYIGLALVLVFVATTATEWAYVFYNAMLPDLAAPAYVGRWSGWGWGMGYIGGMVALVLSLLAFIDSSHPWFNLDRASDADVRATFILTAVWYLVFSIPLFIYTPSSKWTGVPVKEAIKRGFNDIRVSVTNLKQYGAIFRFFIARMFYTDGLITLFTFGGVYAAATFNMPQQDILLFGISLNITAGIGAALFAIWDDRYGGKKMIIISLLCLIVVGSLALLAETERMFWFYGLLVGIFVGPSQASSRSYLARVVPPHLRNQFFGFFALTGKATAFLGPMLVSYITFTTNNQRLGLGIVIVFLIIGVLLMLTVPSEKQLIERTNGTST
jgi:UMF1 family MFS transporter